VDWRPGSVNFLPGGERVLAGGNGGDQVFVKVEIVMAIDGNIMAENGASHIVSAVAAA